MKPEKNNSDVLSGCDRLFTRDANEREIDVSLNAKSSWVDFIKDKFFMWPIGLLFLYLILTGGLGANAWRTQSLSLLRLLDMIFVQVFLAAIAEEFAFRGYLLEKLLNTSKSSRFYIKANYACVIVTFLFISVHIDLWYFAQQAFISSDEMERNIMYGVFLGRAIGIFIFSFCANNLYLKYRNIKLNIAFHATWNALFTLQSLLQGALM